MRRVIEFLTKVALTALVWGTCWWAGSVSLSDRLNLLIIAGGVSLVVPLVWLGRNILDRRPTATRAIWTTTFVHVGLGFLLGIPIVRAVVSHRTWYGATLPIPLGIGRVLVAITGSACLLAVVNLAWKGLGAPFFIALSRRLAADWLYSRTRNPMVLAALAFFLSLGIWFQSLLFVLWVLLLLTPAWLVFLRVYEERELEIRFGAPYLEYKSRTPMLFPKRHNR